MNNMSKIKSLFILRNFGYLMGTHIIINTAPVYCPILLYPLEKMTNVYYLKDKQLDENGKGYMNIRGMERTYSETHF
jgi:hypothetical protein